MTLVRRCGVNSLKDLNSFYSAETDILKLLQFSKNVNVFFSGSVLKDFDVKNVTGNYCACQGAKEKRTRTALCEKPYQIKVFHLK